MLDLKKLIEAGVQFGHQTWRWSPNMRQYIWGKKDGVHLIDVSKTAIQAEKAAQFLESIAAEGKQILWVGTKRPAQGIMQEMGERFKAPYATHRWVGGTLTNYSQVKKSVAKLLHLEEVIAKASTDERQMYTKKEVGSFQKVVNRLRASVGGLINLRWPVGAIVVVDAKKEATAIKEASVMGVPVVALVDTNSSPEGVSIVIPANDDIERSIRLIVDELAAAIARGKERAKEEKAKEVVEVSAEQVGKTAEEEDAEGVRRGTRTRRPATRRVSPGEQQKAERKASSAPKKATGTKTDKPAPRKTASKEIDSGDKTAEQVQKTEESAVAEGAE
ncbi:MAG: 30S ribosomal protein S2 [candidate division TM6 bacterium GW2011_GWF2_43_17]|nr:MAG: 30S ribosomal protein S2 [candidate division TM6 bacterium GW2011_GWF2_43_17]